MRFSDVVIPLRAAWSSPFVRWQGPTADLNSLDLATRVTRRALDERGDTGAAVVLEVSE